MATATLPRPCIQKIRSDEDHPVKLTALDTLAEEIAVERYEGLHEVIAIAKEFGANQSEIIGVLQCGIEELRRNNIKNKRR